MEEDIRKAARPHDGRPGSLGALIHAVVRRAIEVAVEEELTAALGAIRYARNVGRGGYRNGHRSRTVTGPTGPLALRLPRATVFTAMDAQEWSSSLVPRYQRRLREVNEAVVATYLAGGNTRRLRGALAPLLKAAPLSKSAVSRVVGTLKAELEAWRTRSLADVHVFGLYLDAIALRVRSAGKVTSVPVLGVVAILTDGQKQLVALELCGGESFEAWKGCLDDLVARGLGGPVVSIVDGHPGLRKAVGLVWPRAGVQRCAVHKLRNLERKAPKHALAEIRADFHRIVYAESLAAARNAVAAFEQKWRARCPGVVRSLQEGGEELLTFFQFPERQWKTLRTTNVIERLNEEFRRRGRPRARCQPRTPRSSCSSASWSAARSACAASMAGARFRRSCGNAAGPSHDAAHSLQDRVRRAHRYQGIRRNRVFLAIERRAMLNHLDLDWGLA